MLTELTLGKKEETGWSYENARRVKDKQAIQLNKKFSWSWANGLNIWCIGL